MAGVYIYMHIYIYIIMSFFPPQTWIVMNSSYLTLISHSNFWRRIAIPDRKFLNPESAGFFAFADCWRDLVDPVIWGLRSCWTRILAGEQQRDSLADPNPGTLVKFSVQCSLCTQMRNVWNWVSSFQIPFSSIFNIQSPDELQVTRIDCCPDLGYVATSMKAVGGKTHFLLHDSLTIA